MLSVEQLSVAYGDVPVLHGVGLTVAPGQIVAVLGANGAGKSTLLRAVSGLQRPSSGTIRFEGAAMERLEPEAIVGRGISHVPQGRRIFPGLTVHENLVVARTPLRHRTDAPAFDDQLRTVHRLFPRLQERRDQLGWSLSGGEQQMLAVARAMVARPKLILLDEPSLGLAPLVVESLFDAILTIRDEQKVGVLLVEQNAFQALRIADHVYILETGRIVASGSPAELAGDPQIEKAYFGA